MRGIPSRPTGPPAQERKLGGDLKTLRPLVWVFVVYAALGLAALVVGAGVRLGWVLVG